jgi:hypothetical protein
MLDGEDGFIGMTDAEICPFDISFADIDQPACDGQRNNGEQKKPGYFAMYGYSKDHWTAEGYGCKRKKRY